MYKSSVTFLFIIIISSVLFAKATIGIMPFDCPQESPADNAGVTVANAFESELISTGAFAVIERSLLNNIIAEQEMSFSGMTSSEQSIEIGRLAGCEYLLTGTINEIRQTKGMERSTRNAVAGGSCCLFGLPGLAMIFLPVKQYIISVTVKIVDVETGAVVYIGEGTGRNYSLLTAAKTAAKKSLKELYISE